MSRVSGFSRSPDFPCRLQFASFSGVAFVLGLFVAAGPLKAQDAPASAISRQGKDVFERAAKAVVKVHGIDEHGEICGTGFFIDPTGTLYTSYTVGGEAENFTVQFAGKR